MSLTFACPECGKTFTLDDRFAGKKGKCKQCGEIMLIPTHPRPVIAREREAAATNKGPARELRAASADVYGFEDEPLPPRSPAAPANRDDGLDAPPPRTPLYPQRAGYYQGPSRPSSGGDGGLGAVKIIVRVILVIVGGSGGLVGSALMIPGVRSMIGASLGSSRSEIEAFIKRQVDLTEELTGILRTITDVSSAQACSTRANDTVHKLTHNLTANKNRKGLQRDIDDLKQKYMERQRQALENFTAEIQRVSMIPGAYQALAFEEAIMELAAIESQIPGIKEQFAATGQGLPNLRVNPPPRPVVNLPVIPAPVRLDPGFSPPMAPGTMPIPGPAPGPRPPTFNPPRRPGPPGMPPGPRSFPGPGRFAPGGQGPT